MIKINDNLNVYYPLDLVPRTQQLESLDFLVNSICKGNKNFLINSPTGSGKSYLAIMFINWYLNHINENAKFDILTNSKILQQQYVDEFKFIANFKGRANYHCGVYDVDCEAGMEMCTVLKKQCTNCPYKKAREAWIVSQISLTNFHLYNTLNFFADALIKRRDGNVLIIDESHDFEGVFSDYISTTLSSRVLKKSGFGYDVIVDYDKKFKNLSTLPKLVSFIQNQYQKDLDDQCESLEKRIKGADIKVAKELSRYLNHASLQVAKLKGFLSDYTKNKENWVLETTTYKKAKEEFSNLALDIKPVWGNLYLPKAIWDKYDHIIYLSGSLLNKTIFCDINGLDKNLTNYLELDTTFPIANRKIFYFKCGKMTYNEKKETFKKQLKVIEKILKKHKNEKGIIHTNSFEFSEWIKEGIHNDRLLFHNETNREEMLQKHINSSDATVICSPSMISGIDLKNNLARFSIILKMPYPNISSEKIKARQKTNSEWYDLKTAQDLTQCYGRIIRSENDFGSTYVLDSSFSDVLRRNKYLPRYLTNAITEVKM
jgi:Rad3-related DNA helicase